MIKQEEMSVVSQQLIAKNIYELTLEGTLVSEMTLPGQFVHLRVQGEIDPLLRRPISIARIDPQQKRFTMIYRAEGKGTERLSKKRRGETVDVLGPLGKGFPIDSIERNERALLIGGGIGVPPLYELSHRLVERGVEVVHVLGHESAEKVFYEEQFARLGETYIATVDGSLGMKGFVTDVIDLHGIEFDCLYACGPTPMLRAIEKSFPNKRGFISLEQRMGCGIGACFACVCHVAGDDSGTAYRKVCSDGPVFPLGEVII